MEQEFDLVVLGGGPAGYVGAIRGAQLGMRVCLVEEKKVGGTCLHEGCIPTKVLLEVAGFLEEVARSREFGVLLPTPSIDRDLLERHRNSIVNRLYLGILSLMKKNRVEVRSARGMLVSPSRVEVRSGPEGLPSILHAKNILVATGSRPRSWPELPFDHVSVLDSTDAIAFFPSGKKIGIIGGGVVGVEFSDLFQSLGGEVTLFEKADHLVPTEDPDLAEILRKEYERRGIAVHTSSDLSRIAVEEGGVRVFFSQANEKESLCFDAILVAIGRGPNLDWLEGDRFGLEKTSGGFLKVDSRQWTGVAGIYAAGDVTGGMMLAHAASHQAVVAVEQMAGTDPDPVDPLRIPRVVYSHPEIASVGISATEAKNQGLSVREGKFPLMANGRSLIHGERKGMIKIVSCPESGKILGFQGIGAGVSELVSLGTMAMALPDGIEVLTETIFPHPTVSEAIWEAAADTVGRSIHR
ncbi:MAG: dihydrolipoyl dehydrogenase [Leptospirales bacterium]